METKLQRVWFECSKDLLEEIPPILKCIRERFGEYIIEGEIPGRHNVIAISFFTDELEFKEGERRIVMMEMVEDKQFSYGYRIIKLQKGV